MKAVPLGFNHCNSSWKVLSGQLVEFSGHFQWHWTFCTTFLEMFFSFGFLNNTSTFQTFPLWTLSLIHLLVLRYMLVLFRSACRVVLSFYVIYKTSLKWLQ